MEEERERKSDEIVKFLCAGGGKTGGPASLPFIIPRSPPAAKFSRTVFSSERERGGEK